MYKNSDLKPKYLHKKKWREQNGLVRKKRKIVVKVYNIEIYKEFKYIFVFDK